MSCSANCLCFLLISGINLLDMFHSLHKRSGFWEITGVKSSGWYSNNQNKNSYPKTVIFYVFPISSRFFFSSFYNYISGRLLLSRYCLIEEAVSVFWFSFNKYRLVRFRYWSVLLMKSDERFSFFVHQKQNWKHSDDFVILRRACDPWWLRNRTFEIDTRFVNDSALNSEINWSLWIIEKKFFCFELLFNSRE